MEGDSYLLTGGVAASTVGLDVRQRENDREKQKRRATGIPLRDEDWAALVNGLEAAGLPAPELAERLGPVPNERDPLQSRPGRGAAALRLVAPTLDHKSGEHHAAELGEEFIAQPARARPYRSRPPWHRMCPPSRGRAGFR